MKLKRKVEVEIDVDEHRDWNCGFFCLYRTKLIGNVNWCLLFIQHLDAEDETKYLRCTECLEAFK